MAAPQRVVQAVQAGIVASAHLNALQHVAAAAQSCQRLGELTSGRWRSAARDLSALEEKLQTAVSSATEALSSRADDLGVPEDALWAVGDAAATLDLLRDAALEDLGESDTRASAVLDGQILFGVSFLEDPDLPDRGTTLLFAWGDPLAPATWPWQANWIAGSEDSESDELDLFEAGEMEGVDPLVADFAEDLTCSPDEARAALQAAATALTRASLLAASGDADEDEDEDEDEEEGDDTVNGSA